MYGAVYGDVIGSYYELHPTKDYHFPLQPQSTFTDDTVLTVAVCDTLLANPRPIGPLGRNTLPGTGSITTAFLTPGSDSCLPLGPENLNPSAASTATAMAPPCGWFLWGMPARV